MIEKNDILTGKVQSFGSDGEGVVCAEGCVFFVPYALPGEEISFKALKIKGNTGYGKIEKVIVPAKGRVQPKCPVFYTCGGCQLQHANYETQREFKREKVKNALRKIGGVEAEVSPVVACESEYGYRNKLQIPVGVDANGHTALGFYAERSHRLVPAEKCYIHPAWAEDLMAAFREYIAVSGAKGYDERTKKGLLRHLVAREIDGKLLVTVVATARKLPCEAWLTGRLQKLFPGCGVYVNVNTGDTNVIFGDRFYLLCGAARLEGRTGGIAYEAGAETFVQVNPEIREKLYERAMEACFAGGADTVIDAYSGGGLMTAMAAKRCKRAYGVELNKEASACAEALKAKNGLQNMTNICGDAAAEVPAIMDRERALWEKESAGKAVSSPHGYGEKVALILDPPRAGVARSVLQAILKSGIERFVMISCNPATLARDLGILTGTLREENGVLVKVPAAETGETTGKESGKFFDGELPDGAEKLTDGAGERETTAYYEIESVEPFDMFPQTKHVETLVVLSHKET
jgi:23S rRNA (uracil-5-)-methyltransferase rumA